MQTQVVNRVMASFLSVIFPGSGQMANGQWRKGLLALLLGVASVYVQMVKLGTIPYFYLLLWVLCLIDAYQVAKQRDQRGEAVRWGMLLLGGVLSLVALVACVAFAVFSFFDKSDSDKKQVRQEVEQRLQERYHDEFTVQQEVDFSWNTGRYSMLATSKAHPDLTFNVNLSDTEQRELTDNYLENVWSQQSQPRLMPVVQEIFGGDLLLYSNASPSDEYKLQAVPQFQDMVQRYPEQVAQDVRVYLFGSYSAEMEQQMLEKTLKFIQHFPDQEKPRLDVLVNWFDPSLKEKSSAKTGEELYRYLLSNPNSGKTFDLHIWDGRVPQIKTVDDLKPYLWK
jgi:TM2 domain-containing membrane protein YozV